MDKVRACAVDGSDRLQHRTTSIFLRRPGERPRLQRSEKIAGASPARDRDNLGRPRRYERDPRSRDAAPASVLMRLRRERRRQIPACSIDTGTSRHPARRQDWRDDDGRRCVIVFNIRADSDLKTISAHARTSLWILLAGRGATGSPDCQRSSARADRRKAGLAIFRYVHLDISHAEKGPAAQAQRLAGRGAGACPPILAAERDLKAHPLNQHPERPGARAGENGRER
jgi:hypothetical protein